MYEEIQKKLDYIEQELNDIHNELTVSSNISVYKIELLTFKKNVICMIIDKLIDEVKSLADQKTKARNRKNIIKVLFILGLLISPFKIAGIIFLLISIIDKYKKINDPEYVEDKESYEIAKKIESLIRRANNYEELISSHIDKKNKEYLGNNLKGPNKMMIANDCIGFYLCDNDISDIPDDIKMLIIKILQKDLNSESNDLYELLDKAKDKISSESLKKALSREF